MRNKVIMQMAWNIARFGARKHGGKAIEYIAESMKIAWSKFKMMLAKKGGRIAGIAPWFLEKEFGHPSAVAQIRKSTYIIEKETEKAFFIKAVDHDSGMDIVNKFWAPKSVCAA